MSRWTRKMHPTGEKAGLMSGDEECTTTDEGSSDDEDDEVHRRQRRRIAKLMCVLLPIAGVVGIILANVLPWGKPAYNENFFNHLTLMEEANASFTTVCKFKQYMNYYSSSSRGPGPWGRTEDGKRQLFGDLFGLYHHMGVLLEVKLEDGTLAEYIKLDFGYYGLKFFILSEPKIVDRISWNGCNYWCGAIHPEYGTARRLHDEFDSYLNAWNYNFPRFNCLEFAAYIFDYFKPYDEGCEPWEIPR